MHRKLELSAECLVDFEVIQVPMSLAESCVIVASQMMLNLLVDM
jgi:hypothetical protein